MGITKEELIGVVGAVEDPDLRRSLGSLGAVRTISACEGHVRVVLGRGGAREASREALVARVEGAVRQKYKDAGEALVGVAVEVAEGGPTPVRATVATEGGPGSAPGHAHGAPSDARDASKGLPGVRHVIAVGAGKGGVGKSTIAVNLAVALARNGHAVGLMDGDIYGPSVPTLMGLDALETMSRGNTLEPFYVHGVKAMTLGKLVDPDKPLIWRGPMAHGAFKQLVMQTNWGELDYLVIDLPPGTGDVPLTMAQLLSLSGAVIVCTPQKVAQDDAVRAAGMFGQLGIPVLGVVENMSFFVGDDGKEYDLFGKGGAEKMAKKLSVPFLGAVPISTALRKHSDGGEPLKNFEESEENMALKAALEAVAKNVESQAALATMKSEWGRPKLSIT